MAINLDKPAAPTTKYPATHALAEYQRMKIRAMERELDLLTDEREKAQLAATKFAALMFVVGALLGVCTALWIDYMALYAN